ncbi:hypothetical protein OOK36_44135 [Streptomyces sp. NBC_00365]|uniref:hypothetical protein n=1 Tax=Streptomyces sp. NBC_00365 TaxID=2975726 RepID=UPI00225A2367|nr:hypothetical protein [Streptomyces sp. NBC_00365]MCX5095702.1 hypothetical protein [Streptomyces sp. NBC_00365]
MALEHGSLTTLAALGDALRRRMFEDFRFESEDAAPALVRQRNDPFHPLAAKAPELVCRVNQALLAGYLHGLGSDHSDALLVPRSDACCVELGGRDTAGGASQAGTTCGR